MEATEVRKLATLEDRHWWYAERRAVVRRMVRGTGLLSRPTRPLVAIDIGAAGGGNTRVLRDAGMFAVPVEYGSDGASVAKERRLPSVQADARSLPFASGSADLAVAFDVLEHIQEDDKVVAEVARVLAPGGSFLVAVPADMRLWSAHDEAVGHVRRYAREELVDLLSSAGFTIDTVASWNVLLRPVVSLRRRSRAGSDLDEVAPTLNLALRGVIAVEQWVPGLAALPGVSLLVRATAPE